MEQRSRHLQHVEDAGGRDPLEQWLQSGIIRAQVLERTAKLQWCQGRQNFNGGENGKASKNISLLQRTTTQLQFIQSNQKIG